MTQKSGKRPVYSLLSLVPWWNLFRMICLASLVVLALVPLLEIRAMQSSVVFYKGEQAILAWDPPSKGVVDHYVVELTTTREIAGPSNTVTWVNYFISKDNKYKIQTRNNYIYSFRVKAVGPAGNESPYSDEQLTIICDCSEPRISISPTEHDKAIRSDFIHLSGTFSDNNIAEIKVEDKKAALDFADKTWHVTVPLNDNTNLITITAKDYAGNIFSQQYEIRNRPLVIRTEPEGGNIFVMGTPSYPGIFFSSEALTIGEVVEPGLRLPFTVWKQGYMQFNTVLSFQGEQDTVTLLLKTLRTPSSFLYHPVAAPLIENIYKLPYIFAADMDLDKDLDIILSYPGEGAYLLRSNAEISDGGWNATSLDFRLETGPVEKPELKGQLFYIDYDSDLKYELLSPAGQDGKIHIYECNGTAWTSGQNDVIDLPDTYKDIKNFGFLDWNSDHNKDIFLRVQGEQKVHILMNQGSDFEPWFSGSGLSYPLPDLNPASPVSICDWNSDGEPDFIGQDASGNLCVWINSRTGDQAGFDKTLLPVDQESLPGNVLSVSAADWDNDGVYDLVIGTDTGGVFLLLGRLGY